MNTRFSRNDTGANPVEHPAPRAGFLRYYLPWSITQLLAELPSIRWILLEGNLDLRGFLGLARKFAMEPGHPAHSARQG